MAKMSWLNYLLWLSFPAGAKEVDCSWVRIRVQVTWSSCIFISKEKSVIYDVYNLYIAALVDKIWAVLGNITALSKPHQVHLPFQTYSHELHAAMLQDCWSWLIFCWCQLSYSKKHIHGTRKKEYAAYGIWEDENCSHFNMGCN